MEVNETQKLYNKNINVLLSLALLFPILNRSIQEFFRFIHLPINGGIIIYGLMLSSICYFLIKHYKIILKRFVIVYIITLLIFIFNYIYFIDTQEYYIEYQGYLQRILLIFIPTAIMVTKVSDFRCFFRWMKPVSYIGILLGVICVFFKFHTEWGHLIFSNYLLPFPMFLYYFLRRHFKLQDFLFFIVGITLITLYGGRMSMFSIITYIIINELFNSYFKDKRLFIINLSVIISFGAILFFTWNYIILFISNLLSVFNIDSRNLESLVNKNALSFETRMPIFEYIKYELSLQGFGMNGIFGDRVALRKYGSWIAYSHNIVFEILISFGFILGTLLILIFIFKYIKSIFKGNLDRKNIILLFSCLVILRLFVSGSFVIEDNFYLMLGILSGRENIQR